MELEKKDPFRHCAWIPAAAAIVALWIGIALDIQSSRSSHDQDLYHLPTIHKFESELPRPNLRDYQSATTPGYHLVMAGASRMIGNHPRILRGAGALFTVALLAAFGAMLAGRAGGLAAAAMAMPMAANVYVYSSGVWLLPDNAGWLFVLLSMVCLLREPYDGKTAVVGGVLVLALMMLRQSHLWICAPFLAAAWMSCSGGRRWGMLAITLLALAPAMGALGYFYRIWGGTTPPAFIETHQHMNYASPAMILASALLPGLGYLSLLMDRLDLLKARKRWIIVCGVIGLILSAAPETAYDIFQGRYSGWWNLARYSVIFDRSPVIIMMATAGGMLIGVYLAGMPKKRDRALFSVIITAFIIGNTVGAYAYQRYYDPFLLMIFPMMATRGNPKCVRWEWRKMAGPIGLFVASLAITLLFIRGSG